VRRIIEAAAAVGAALAGLGALMRFAPAYLSRQGFPADEAWTAAVHARALALTGTLAFNPGEAAPGVVSLLWTALVAPIHLLVLDSGSAVLATKLLGFALHVASALVLLLVLDAAGVGAPERLLGAALVAFHPDLIAASVSGLEVPLAALAACALLRASQADTIWGYAALAALLPFVRPDLALIACVLPLFAIGRADRARLARTLVVAGVASAAALALVLGRDLALGAPLVGPPSPAALPLPLADAEIVGFRDLLGQIAITDSSLLLILAIAAAAWRLFADEAPGAAPDAGGGAVAARVPAAAVLTGLAFCAGTIALHPVTPSRITGVFGLAEQRHALAALPLIVGPLPAVLRAAAAAWLPARARAVGAIALAAVLVTSVAVHAPRRHVLLASDARSVDELQVAAGRLLAGARPTEAIWAVYPGAIRYFGSARVIPLGGAIEPEMTGPDAARFLAAPPPRFIEIVPGRTELDPASRPRVRAARLESRARDVWTGSIPGEERWIVLCADPAVSGQLVADARLFPFRCADGPPGSAPSR